MKTVKKGIKLCLRLVFVFLAVTCVLTALGYGYAADTFNRIKENIVRLHVIANSDSQEDQALKLQVRDKVIECIDSLELDAESAGAYVKALCENLIPSKSSLKTICAVSDPIMGSTSPSARAISRQRATAILFSPPGGTMPSASRSAREREKTGGASCFRRFAIQTTAAS